MQLIWSPSALKKLVKINPKDKSKIERKIAELLKQPLSGKPLQGEYANFRSLRAWPLRVIYSFSPDTQTITIVAVDYRGQVYK